MDENRERCLMSSIFHEAGHLGRELSRAENIQHSVYKARNKIPHFSINSTLRIIGGIRSVEFADFVGAIHETPAEFSQTSHDE